MVVREFRGHRSGGAQTPRNLASGGSIPMQARLFAGLCPARDRDQGKPRKHRGVGAALPGCRAARTRARRWAAPGPRPAGRREDSSPRPRLRPSPSGSWKTTPTPSPSTARPSDWPARPSSGTASENAGSGHRRSTTIAGSPSGCANDPGGATRSGATGRLTASPSRTSSACAGSSWLLAAAPTP